MSNATDRDGESICKSILEAVGRTPVVELSRLFAGHPTVRAFAKLEFLNPSGSIKDRMVRYMLAAADARPDSKRSTFVESSSGNTGASLAMHCAVGRFDCEIAVPASTSQEKIDRLRAYGARVHVCADSAAGSDPEYYAVGRSIAQSRDGMYLDQYRSHLNREAHYADTAPEFWAQLGARLDCFVCGIGSGGTISGVGRFLKEQNPRIRVVGVEPKGSVFQGGSAQGGHNGFPGSMIEGIGKRHVPESLDPSVLDEVIQIDDQTSIEFTRRLAREEGIMAGGSSGAVTAAIAVLAEQGVAGRIGTIFPDSGVFYLSKLYD